MDPDKYQQAWQAHSSQTRVTVDADSLLKVVQRNQRDFRATILVRDVGEVGVGLVMLPYWIYQGLTGSLPWTWWLGVPAIIWVIGFFVVDRMRHPQTPSDPGEPLLSCVKNSLNQVEHQIWLLRNIFWWYLLPFTIALLAFFGHVAWQSGVATDDWLAAFAFGTSLFVFVGAIYYFIYYVNQRAVRTQLEPRRQELLKLRASLSDETTSEVSGEYPILMGAGGVKPLCSPRRSVIGFLCAAVIFVVVIAGVGYLITLIHPEKSPVVSNYDGPPRSSGPAGDSLAKLITELRKEKSLTGLAAMVMVDGQVEAAAAQGERKIGSGVPLEISDRWHLGGITKSITATMIARLIESGQMQWSDTVGKIFPEASLHQDWKPVTLRQLLTDTAGAPANFPKDVWLKRPAPGPECTEARREAVLNVIAGKPAYPPGKKYVYSNVGYVIAGAMAEKVTGAAWEDLVKREVFGPLKLTESGFGPPKSADETLEQPRGHRDVPGGKIPVDDKSDNTPIMGPSATIHMSLQNLCTFAREHMLGQLGKGQLLSTETYKLLHTPELNDYACGWIRNEPNAAIPNTEYWHNGTNTYWYALVAFIPEMNMVVAVTSNDGDRNKAEAAAVEVLKFSVKKLNVEAELPVRESRPTAVPTKASSDK